MKPKVVEYIFKCYSEKKPSLIDYDVVDRGPRVVLQSACFSGGSELDGELMLQELNEYQLQHQPVNALPYAEGHADLEQGQRELAREFGRQLSDMSDEFELYQRRGSLPNNRTTVQFENRSKFVKSDDGIAQITIVRTGNSQSEFEVAWKTIDKNAEAGRHYLTAEGLVTFLPGETNKVIEVELLDDHMDNSIAFQVELFNPRFVDIGPFKTFDVNINDFEHLPPGVQSTIRSIINAPTVRKVKECFLKNVTTDTFKTAVLRLCGESNSLPQEFRMAFDLLNCATQHRRFDSFMTYVTNYFESAPELEEISIMEVSEVSDEDSD